jgi:hypothetical protein
VSAVTHQHDRGVLCSASCPINHPELYSGIRAREPSERRIGRAARAKAAMGVAIRIMPAELLPTLMGVFRIGPCSPSLELRRAFGA